MTTALTIILAVVQILLFVLFGLLGFLQLKDYYRDKKFHKEDDAKQAEINETVEKTIMLKIRTAYSSGLKDGLRQQYTDKTFNSHWKEEEPEFKKSIHRIVNIMAGTED